MAREVVFDFAETFGALVPEFIGSVENTWLDPQTGLSLRALHGFEGGLRRIEDDAPQGSLDLAEQAVFDRVPFEVYGG
jgi:hypothetical protein